jgi:hypothetical protein
MSKKKKLMITWTEDGVAYIRVVDSGIEALIFAIDGIPMVFFGKEKTAHVRVSVALEWHKKELPHTRNEKHRALRERAIARLEEIAARAPFSGVVEASNG